MKKLFLLSLLFLILITPSFAQKYANVQFNINNDGTTLISGISNQDFLKNTTVTNTLTSKKNKYWTFKLDLEDNFSDYIFSINLPKNAQINYIKSQGNPVISYDQNIKITEIGENKPINIIIQYNIKNENYDSNILILSILIIIFSGIIIYTKNKKTKINKSDFNNILKNLPINERQKSMLKLIIKNNNQIKQNTFEKELKLPKSSISRNIESLKNKNIIKKIKKGNINIITLNEDKFSNKITNQ